MPQVGETKIVRVKETRRYIWVQCRDCKQERWMQERNFKRGGSTGMCLKCFNKSQRAELARIKSRASRAPKPLGKKMQDREGYVSIRLSPDDFFFPMAKSNGYVLEHRLVMAKHLNRCLLPWEVVHHKPPGIKNDNRLEKLELLPTNKYHLIDSKTKSYIRKLEDEIAHLRQGKG